jgi:hypothetical protein
MTKIIMQDMSFFIICPPSEKSAAGSHPVDIPAALSSYLLIVIFVYTRLNMKIRLCIAVYD